MAYHSDLVEQILYFCVAVEILDQKSILSEIHVCNSWSFHAFEEVALGVINAAILNLPYLLSSFCIVHVVFACCNTYLLVHLSFWGSTVWFLSSEVLTSLGLNRVDEVPRSAERWLAFQHSRVGVSFAVNSSCSIAAVLVFSPRPPLAVLCWSTCSCGNRSSSLLK